MLVIAMDNKDGCLLEKTAIELKNNCTSDQKVDDGYTGELRNIGKD